MASVAAACLLTACAHAAAAPDQAQGAEAEPARSTANIERDTFALELSTPQFVRVDDAAAVSLLIEGRGEYHVNEEYPMRIVLRASPDLALASTELTAADATEMNPQRARFEVPFTCHAPGAHRIDVDIEFALCTQTTCIPETLSLTLDLQSPP